MSSFWERIARAARLDVRLYGCDLGGAAADDRLPDSLAARMNHGGGYQETPGQSMRSPCREGTMVPQPNHAGVKREDNNPFRKLWGLPVFTVLLACLLVTSGQAFPLPSNHSALSVLPVSTNDALGNAADSSPEGNIAGNDQLAKIMNKEVFVIDEHSIKVRQFLMALLVLVFGILLLRIGIRLFQRRVLPRTTLKPNEAVALTKILYYFGVLIVLLFSMRMVNLPITAFAFVGGALAIGVGFGAQNLINNFISGFIIMAERPIRLGDLIEIEGNFARVEDIGPRCTRIRTGENIHILVPNSSFLEKNIVNWTLADPKVRAHVTVGVVYGSPVREVEQLLLLAAGENEKVMRAPEPFVLFRDFGDNALIFSLHFWLIMESHLERLMLESNIRFRVDELFREAGIVIAFPQRDVHLDTTRPLELKVMDPGGFLRGKGDV